MNRQLFFDEMGNGISFIIKARFRVDDCDYIALLDAEHIDYGTFILREEYDESGDVYYAGIDEEEYVRAMEIYEELLIEQAQ
ncbi:Uncharacterised protein [Aedoeadaptatus ivorii]|uniref:DUF1292 domain-containing protein n=1 Tax=Aedoeadaptatus ivorii TaxID=54006 RepID=A0A448V1Q9_9FIRM|nr:DUF1292 domain-containing protein [Peptoniphilus ivorii]MDQ0508924.1 hypothetical protein [Peptoniphilus ivorii]VEJ35750.1 Uncharacterised protein [Peptoniphilus ivorii]